MKILANIIETINFLHIILGYTLFLGLLGLITALLFDFKYFLGIMISFLICGFLFGLYKAIVIQKTVGCTNYMGRLFKN